MEEGGGPMTDRWQDPHRLYPLIFYLLILSFFGAEVT